MQDQPAPIPQAVTELLAELERARAAEACRAAYVAAIEAQIQQAATGAYIDKLAELRRGAEAVARQSPDASAGLSAALEAATETGARLLLAVGVDLGAAAADLASKIGKD